MLHAADYAAAIILSYADFLHFAAVAMLIRYASHYAGELMPAATLMLMRHDARFAIFSRC